MIILTRIIKGFAFFAFGGAVIFGVFYAYLASLNGKPAEEYKVFANETSKPLVIAHRGGMGLAPENTLKAFRRSFELGVDVLELDIHATKDGELVVIHDKSVDRTTDGKGLVKELTLEEIRKFDAGFNWTKDEGKTFSFRAQNIKIPTLREVFETFPDIKINIEAKHETPSPAKPLCALIREFDRTDKVIVASFSDKVLEDFRQNCPGVATSASPSESSSFLAMYKIGLSKNYAARMQALQIPQTIFGFEIITKDFIQAAREQNLKLHIWTINKKKDMNRLIEIGADGIMTDYPDRLLELIERKKNKRG